ncbi:MAG: hypothetical protein AAGE80_00170 [Pseudomonadota bacterium]
MISLLIHAKTARASDPCILFCAERVEQNVWLTGYLSQSEVDRLARMGDAPSEADVKWQEALIKRFSLANMLVDISEYIYTRSDLTSDDVIDREKLTRSVDRLVPAAAEGEPDVLDQAFEVANRITSERAKELKAMEH